MVMINPTQFSAGGKILRECLYPGKIIDISAGIVTYRMAVDIDLARAQQKNCRTVVLKLSKTRPGDPPTLEDLRARLGFANAYDEATYAEELRGYRTQVERNVIDRKELTIEKLIDPVAGLPDFSRSSPARYGRDSQIIESVSPFLQASSAVNGVSSTSRFANPEFSDFLDDKPPSSDFYDPSLPAGFSGPPPNEQGVMIDAAAKGVDPAVITTRSNIANLLLDGPLAERAAAMVYTPPATAPFPMGFLYEPRLKKAEVEFKVRESDLVSFGSSLTLVVSLVTFSDVELNEVLKVDIPYQTHRNQYAIPDLAPELAASYIGRSKISVNVESVEEKVKTVRVFRRRISVNPHDHGFGTGWERVLNINLNRGESASFVDDILTDDVVAYRAIGYGSTGRPGQEFSHVLVRPLPADVRVAANALTANAEIDQERQRTVKITVSDLVRNTYRVELMRYDVTGDSREAKRRNEGPGFIYIPTGDGNTAYSRTQAGFDENESLHFYDTSIVPGRLYQYVPVGYDTFGSRWTGTDYLMRVPYSLGLDICSINVTAPRRTDTGVGSLSLEFEMEGQITEFAFNQIQASLSAQGNNLYRPEIEENRSQFGKLINFLVQREDTRTGEIVDFGVYPRGSFVDNAEKRGELGIPDPEENVTYVYKVQALINSTDELFPDVTETGLDQGILELVRTNLSLLASSKTRSTGIMPSTARQFDATVADSFFSADARRDGNTGVSSTKRFSFTSAVAGGVEMSSLANYEDYDFLEWIYKGNIADVDHFRVSIVSDGGRVLLDCVPCDPSLTMFCYKHYNTGYASNLRYEVKAIGLTYQPLSSDSSSLIRATLSRSHDLSIAELTRVVTGGALTALNGAGAAGIQKFVGDRVDLTRSPIPRTPGDIQ